MSLDDLAFTDLVFLHALMVADAGMPLLGARPSVVAPSDGFYYRMVEMLSEQGLIARAKSAVNDGLVVLPRSGGQTAAYTLHCSALADHSNPRNALADYLKGHRRDFRKQQQALWVSLGIAELHGYMEWELAIHHFEGAWTDELFDVFTFGLAHFAIAQLFYFCWTGVRDLASRHQRVPAPMEFYRMYLLDSLGNKVRRAIREGWEVRHYTRHWRRPTSAVVETFSGPATDLGDRFLSMTPSYDALNELF